MNGFEQPVENEEGVRDPRRRKFVKYGIAAAGAAVLGLAGYFLLGKQLTLTTRACTTLWEDERISITLDKIERTDTIPPAERLLPNASPYTCQSPPPLSDGCDYVIVYFTISRIERAHITNLFEETPLLTDDRDGKAKLICGSFQVVLTDPSNPRESNIEVPVGAKGFIVYELTTQAKPATLELAYSYVESWEQKGWKQKDRKYARIVMQLCP
jgi:hypothetical protein